MGRIGSGVHVSASFRIFRNAVNANQEVELELKSLQI